MRLRLPRWTARLAVAALGAAALTVPALPASAAATPPSAVPSLQAGTVAATTVELTWSPAAPGTSPIAGYDVFASLPGRPAPARIVLSTTTSWAYVTAAGLAPATTYRFVVRAPTAERYGV